MEYSHLPACTVDSLGWLVYEGVLVQAMSTVHALVMKK